MKIEQGGTSLMDLVLCAVGCMLLFFILQITAPRAPGRDDRPLVVSARALALDATQETRMRFRWRLIAPDGRVVTPEHPPGVSVRPVDQTTSSKQPVLTTIAEPLYGVWTLQVIIETEVENVDPAFREALVDRPREKKDNPAWQQYFQALSTYRTVRAADTRFEDYRRFEELLKKADTTAIATENAGTHLARRDPELERYVSYRILCLRAGYLSRILSEKTRASTELDQARTSLSQVEVDIQQLLAELEKTAKQAKQGDDTHWASQRLWLALQADEESREARSVTPDGQTAAMPKRSKWKALDAELSVIKPPLRSGGQDYRTSSRYFAVRSDWIRWRSAFDYGIDVGSTPIQRRLLQEGLEFGRNDPFMQFIVEEFRVVIGRDDRVRIEIGMAWGDTAWPARISGSKEIALFAGHFRSRSGDAGRPIVLAEITIEKGRDEPRVELSSLIQAIKDNP